MSAYAAWNDSLFKLRDVPLDDAEAYRAASDAEERAYYNYINQTR